VASKTNRAIFSIRLCEILYTLLQIEKN